MEVENVADDIITFIPEREPHLNGELKTVADILTDRDDCDVIIDFAKIDIVTSPSLAKLLRLRQILTDNKHRLILCNINWFTRGAFQVTGLDGIYELTDDRPAAEAAMQLPSTVANLD